MQSDWKRAFRLITCVSEFLQIWGLHGNTENYDVFILKYIQQKVIANCLENSKKPYVWLTFGHFRPFQKNCKFLKNQALSQKSASVNFGFQWFSDFMHNIKNII